ncbi:MAG: SAM-dependent methyltransferase, partial [Candidatus Azotimanducaceae bacterium]
DVDFLTQGCEDLPLGSGSIDSALVTWTFCTIPDPESALAEIRRVLKPGGQLIFVEHGLAKDEKVKRTQNRINPIWRRLAGGCHLNRKPDSLLLDAGFKLDMMTEGFVPGPKFATYNYRGIAKLA